MNIHQSGQGQSSSDEKYLQTMPFKHLRTPLLYIDVIHVINLKRRPDRLLRFFNSSRLARTQVQVHEAFDGHTLTAWSNELEDMFGNNTWGSEPGPIGAAKSHFAVRCMSQVFLLFIYLLLRILANDAWNIDTANSLTDSIIHIFNLDLEGNSCYNWWAASCIGRWRCIDSVVCWRLEHCHGTGTAR